ncbi:MAG: hypothetical protein LQ338_003404 [Usnochroma carphineum]|nr:MAG: hypothetical protein LQ338_003404 [Usnochroma carphineum]
MSLFQRVLSFSQLVACLDLFARAYSSTGVNSFLGFASIMHLIPSINSLVAVALFSDIALAIHPKHHAFLKRQGCSSVDSACSSVGASLSDCVNYICGSCTSVDPAISQCCKLSSDSDIADCISGNVGTTGASSSFDTGDFDSASGSAAATSLSDGFGSAATSTGFFDDSSLTGSAALTTTSVYPACSSLGSKIEACESATPGFANYRLWDTQASCLCYQGSSYQPSSFDNYYSSCLGYLSTADFEAYSELTVGTDEAVSTPCADIGNVRATAAATKQGGVGGGATNTPSPGDSPTTRATTPTGTTSRSATTPTSTTSRPSPSGGPAVAGSGVEVVPLKSAFALLGSFIGVLYLL